MSEDPVWRWGMDVTLGGWDAVTAFGRWLDRTDLAAVTSLDLSWELTFRSDVTADHASAVAADLATAFQLVAPPLLDRYPTGDLQVRCVPFAPVPIDQLALLHGVILGGTSDATTACFTVGPNRLVEFPAGYSASPDPLTVLDARGHPVATIGDRVGGTGGWGGTGGRDSAQHVWRGNIRRS